MPFLLKLKQTSILASIQYPPPPTNIEEPGSSAPSKADSTREASALKSKHLFYLLFYMPIFLNI